MQLTKLRAAPVRQERAMPKVTLEAFDLIRDSETLLRWLAQPHVAKWWGDAARAMQHASECAPESRALIVADGTPVGYLCWQHPPKEELEAADLTDLPSGLVDIDILIGDPDLLGQGVGSQALGLLLTRLRGEPSVAFAGLGTCASNTNAIRCYQKAGFRLHREFQDPEWGLCKYLIAEVHGAA
jgi:aminoglycoside 6'-N-acetyltransferase